MKSKLLALMLLAGGTMFAGSHFSVGVNIGGPAYYSQPYYLPPPPPVPAYAYSIPPAPGPGYTYVQGYWSPAGRSYTWRPGYWVRPPHRHARWVAPAYRSGVYFNGYWR
jgi:hypothetical protein